MALKPQSCPKCVGHGQKGMDHCHTCDGTGSIFDVDGVKYPNTAQGHQQAAYARRVTLGKEPRKRTDYQREYKRIWREKRKENGDDYS